MVRGCAGQLAVKLGGRQQVDLNPSPSGNRKAPAASGGRCAACPAAGGAGPGGPPVAPLGGIDTGAPALARLGQEGRDGERVLALLLVGGPVVLLGGHSGLVHCCCSRGCGHALQEERRRAKGRAAQARQAGLQAERGEHVGGRALEEVASSGRMPCRGRRSDTWGA